MPQTGAAAVAGGVRAAERRPTRSTPGSVGGRPGTSGRPVHLRGDALFIAVVAVLSALVAILVSRLVFPHLSVDNDEPIYRMQAQALAHGHLFPVAPADADAYRPWLSVVRDGHYVLKYTPVVPGLLALSLLVSGSFLPALAGVAAGTVVVTYLLADEVWRDRRVARVATVLMAASPLVLMQSGMLLPYLPSLLLIETGVWGALRWRRTGGWAPLLGAGLAAGLAVAARPFDALLLLGPVGLWLLVVCAGRRMRLVSGVVLGALPPAATLLAYDAAATGDPLRMPFNLLEKSDKLGFGTRRLFPTDAAHRFGVLDGLTGVGRHLLLLGIGWVAGGVLLVVAAGWAVRRRGDVTAAIVLAVGGIALCLGYIPFWGAWNAAVVWGGIQWIGPFYFTPLLMPVVVLGARGAVHAWDHRRRLAQGALALASVGLVAVAAMTLPANLRQSSRDAALVRLMARADGGLVLFDSGRPFLQHPSAVIDDGLVPGGPVVYALQGGARDLRVAAAWPGRPLYRLRIYSAYDPRHRPRVMLTRVDRRTGTSVPLLARLQLPRTAVQARLVLQSGSTQRAWDLPLGMRDVRLVVDASGVTPLGLTPVSRPLSQERVAGRRTVAVTAIPDGEARIGVEWRSTPRGKVSGEHDDVSIARAPGGLDVLVPGATVGQFGGTTAPAVTVSLG